MKTDTAQRIEDRIRFLQALLATAVPGSFLHERTAARLEELCWVLALE